jgi:hypothetical protein
MKPVDVTRDVEDAATPKAGANSKVRSMRNSLDEDVGPVVEVLTPGSPSDTSRRVSSAEMVKVS